MIHDCETHNLPITRVVFFQYSRPTKAVPGGREYMCAECASRCQAHSRLTGLKVVVRDISERFTPVSKGLKLESI